jgi:hypothetical protein
MEGFEWYAIWLMLIVPGIIAGFVIFTFGRLIWKWRSGIKTEQSSPATCLS